MNATERFLTFHKANPDVYTALAILAHQWINSHPRQATVGIDLLACRLRWESLIRTGTDPKINNDYLPYYARLLMRDFERLDGCFRTRVSAADEDLDIWAGQAAA